MTGQVPLLLQLAKSYTVDMDRLRDEISRLARLRHEALKEARRQGFSDIEIGEVLGISRQQVNRVRRGRSDGWRNPH